MSNDHKRAIFSLSICLRSILIREDLVGMESSLRCEKMKLESPKGRQTDDASTKHLRLFDQRHVDGTVAPLGIDDNFLKNTTLLTWKNSLLKDITTADIVDV